MDLLAALKNARNFHKEEGIREWKEANWDPNVTEAVEVDDKILRILVHGRLSGRFDHLMQSI